MLYAVIVAGGQGTRLWPVSRRNNPKQLYSFDGGETLLQRTYKRMLKVVPREQIFIETNKDYKKEILEQLPNIDKTNIILEPASRNTAPAVGLAAAVIQKLDADATMINVWADHYIADEKQYKNKILLADKLLQKHPGYLVNIGSEPKYPATAFGYLKTSGRLGVINGEVIYKVSQFVEKPNLTAAKKYVRAGNYYWNTALFVWKVNTLLEMYQQYKPKIYDGLMKIQAAWGTNDQDKTINRIFPKLEKVAIDYAIFEKARNIALIPADIGWRDIGSWRDVYDILSKTGGTIVQKGKVRAIQTTDSLIFNENKDKLVVVIGMNNVVIVDTQDALLVMQKDRDQTIKNVIKEIEISKEAKFL
ncbi:mannose-1-phosphate guanylyltransferase [candidate division Kazan bacterium]|uniref:mannose-1-phosphate guanylyltransferase n=1 Tax=candidate division Kazan bacterium TaxID=2202143 RepID=A0A420ZCW3_UNCK3|nr:MAG: mannose-1-phosphate guanylyltransferase [candidate division Kazan bacterium]